MKQRERQLRRYYRQIKSWIPCAYTQKKDMLNRIRHTVEVYVEDHPDVLFSEVQAHFGTPQQIAATYVEEMGTQELLYGLRVKKRIVRVLMFCAVIAIAIWLSTAIVATIDTINAQNGYLEVGGIVVYESPEG